MIASNGQQQPAATADDDKSPPGEPAPGPAMMNSAAQPAPHPAVHAARAVMHPEHHDPDWRYYHGAMGG